MQQCSLDGAWTVTPFGTADSIPAQVPGVIHLDLLAAGRIPDPYDRDNEEGLQWISDVTWVYQREVTVTADMLAHDRVLLRCHGLDTLATISINGTIVAQTENMYRRWEFDVKPLLTPGENTIAIQFDPATAYICQRQSERHLPCWAGPREIKGRCWIRKEPANFGWDWGPVLITCGIWQHIELVAFNTARVTDLHVLQEHAEQHVTLQAVTTVECVEEMPLRVVYRVAFDGQMVAEGRADVLGTQAIAQIEITDPHRWWPNGMGAQPLYTVQCTLYRETGEVLDTATQRIGLRSLRLQRTQDAWGESFQFVVNGVPFFAKGANWIPADTFAPRVNRDQYAHLLRSAAEAHCNMLRVWGGGVYETGTFYDLCDELGLCVWQDFIFACSTYPTFDETFTASVLAEVVDNVTRLRNHPALALWCGNNELEMGLVGPDWAESHMSWEDYTRLFDNLLPELVTMLDPQHDYWPGSPHSPYGTREEHANPQWGDAHLWDVWHKKQPFDWYRTTEHRFISEFGFQSFPGPETVAAFTAPEDRNVTSYVMEHHQRSVIGNGTILTYMLDWFQMPTSFDMTLWLSQILQGVGLQYGVEHWRRNRPRTMGTIYWQLNDCWPVASWSTIDYFGRWKASHYFTRRCYAPVLISGVEDAAAGTVAVHVTSDLLHPLPASVRWRITDTEGTLLEAAQLEKTLPAAQDTPVGIIPLPRDRNPRDLLLWLEVWADAVCVASNLVTLVRPKHLTLRDPQLTYHLVQDSPTTCTITLTAEHPALWAWVTLGEVAARFSDNFLHLHPAAPQQVRVTLAEPTSPEILAQVVRVYSLFDTYQPR